MPQTILITLILYALLCVFTGFVSNGEGYNSIRYANTWGLISIVGGLVSIILCVVHTYWIGILFTALVYIVCLNIGAIIMRSLIRKLRRGHEHNH